ncbi:hypothetical protein [Emcibacter nanhaiensis]|uniref:Uncharacterized protein n=1 Tax=Emcibacter nanhaiensis TaxID=1505037 RepID=A0A501PGC6_9PROT|nr:hypothetical protein [Emcibacter nanhaiensis]TPD59021.1 hypothetical protein FIV46_12350 [Emcibacter nanhaiensis]
MSTSEQKPLGELFARLGYALLELSPEDRNILVEHCVQLAGDMNSQRAQLALKYPALMGGTKDVSDD